MRRASTIALVCMIAGWGCASQTPPEVAAVKRAERQFRVAYAKAITQSQSEINVVQLRYRANDCELELPHEAYIFGVWQRVQVIASPELLEKIKEQGAEASIEVLAKLSNSLYTAKSGQSFSILHVERLSSQI
ncbi:MAG: hypothetical protein WC966_09765 [Bradymonadales bacterium]|jgi:hypothetical protein